MITPVPSASVFLAIGAASAEFDLELEPGAFYVYTATVDTWIAQGAEPTASAGGLDVRRGEDADQRRRSVRRGARGDQGERRRLGLADAATGVTARFGVRTHPVPSRPPVFLTPAGREGTGWVRHACGQSVSS